jgi:hypothetical protein
MKIDRDLQEKLREALLTVTALKRSMELALSSDPSAVWKHAAYRQYMRKYNDIVTYIKTFTAIAVPVDLYDISKVGSFGDTVMPIQKELFESVHANLSILEAYLSTKTALQEEKIENLRHFLEANLRKAVFEVPQLEREVQNAVEQLLIGRGLIKGIDYDREVGRVKVSIKEVIPDFVLPKLALALEIKLSKTEGKSRMLVDEINADVLAYGKSYRQMLFIVYDLGTIRDVLEFTRDLETADGVEVIVIKH